MNTVAKNRLLLFFPHVQAAGVILALLNANLNGMSGRGVRVDTGAGLKGLTREQEGGWGCSGTNQRQRGDSGPCAALLRGLVSGRLCTGSQGHHDQPWRTALQAALC